MSFTSSDDYDSMDGELVYRLVDVVFRLKTFVLIYMMCHCSVLQLMNFMAGSRLQVTC